MSIHLLLFYALTIIVIIQCIYYLCFTFFFALKSDKNPLKRNIPLSIVICAKNEADNLKKNLPFILDQKYNNFEVVLINDSSSDETLKVMEYFQSKHDSIHVVDVKSNETFWGNKKYALSLGIKVTNHDFLVFTDADCKPISKNWLTEISRYFSNEKSIVLGYGAYVKKPLSILNKLIRFETLMTAIQYFSYAMMGLPYMGVGRNLAYRKDLFFNNSGFKNHIKLMSGDDDLFINEVANAGNTAICFTKESIMISEPKKTFKDWILQKRRHVGTAKYYKSIHKILLTLFYLSQLLFWVLAVICLFSGNYWQWALVCISLRFIVQWSCIGFSARKLGEMDLIYFAPVLELFLISTQLFIFSANLISKPKYWK